VSIVGPICETADQLGTDRWLPPTAEGDVLLIANCGAYGYAMGSNYNLRPPAHEFIIEP
jgi:diaminopimelate decarboxylase/aspartate kinase